MFFFEFLVKFFCFDRSFYGVVLGLFILVLGVRIVFALQGFYNVLRWGRRIQDVYRGCLIVLVIFLNVFLVFFQSCGGLFQVFFLRVFKSKVSVEVMLDLCVLGFGGSCGGLVRVQVWSIFFVFRSRYADRFLD